MSRGPRQQQKDSGKRVRRGKPRTALFWALVLTSSFVVVELVGGILANSLALLADAGHMVSDSAALGLSLFATWIARRPHTERRTFGYHRAEILAALINGGALLVIAAFIVWHALGRLERAPEIAITPMLVVAAAGLVMNLGVLRLLGHHRHHNLNVRGAFLHVLSDALGSLGVVVAAIVMAATGWTAADALVSILIAGLIVAAGVRLVRDTTSVLLESSPKHLDPEKLKADLEGVPGVRDVHDLHVWTVTSGFVSLSCHARLEERTVSDEVLREAMDLLRHRYDIHHVTIQPESSRLHEEGEPCCLDNHRPKVIY